MKRIVSEHSTVGVSQDQVSSNLDEQVVILNFGTGMYYGLDEVGARIWNFIQTPRAVKEIRDMVVERYDVSPDICEADLYALLDRLADEGLVEFEDAARA